MPIPEHEKFVVNAAFPCPGNEGMAQFVRAAGEQPPYGYTDGIGVGAGGPDAAERIRRLHNFVCQRRSGML